MTAIPKVSAEACEEAYYKIINKNIKILEEEELRDHLSNVSKDFTNKQPEIQKFVSKLIEGHMEHTDGMLGAAQFILYVIMTIESIYIQKEIDDIAILFKEGDKNE